MVREFRNDVVEAAAISSSLIMVGLATSRRSPGATCAVSTGGQASERAPVDPTIRQTRSSRAVFTFLYQKYSTKIKVKVIQ